jgi:GH15 family glucan-1,4-alpha-glucosidase
MSTLSQIPLSQVSTVSDWAKAESQPRIEDHALIGDMHSAALITKGGTIDWLCLPAFDSDACFAALLGTAENGYWRIAPTEEAKTLRRYRKDTLILESDFTTKTGTVRLVDFMPPWAGRDHSEICRSAECLEGKVQMRSELTPRFAFGHAVPRVVQLEDAAQALAGPDALYLFGGPTPGSPLMATDFELSKGDFVSYVLADARSWEAPPHPSNYARAERETEEYWRVWCSKIQPPARWRDEVVRSLITLKACTYEPTGGIVAAPTTSLPETPGGERNWDYRFCWLRDAVLTVNALTRSGLAQEAVPFFRWAMRAVAGDPAQVQIMYGIRGERRLSEVQLGWLEGYGSAKPVRVGNAAYEQFQLDVLGELSVVIYEVSKRAEIRGPLRADAERALFTIARYVSNAWRRPDRGIWEMRGPERSFTASKVSAWSSIDRAIRYAEENGYSEPLDNLRAERAKIFEDVCTNGYNKERNTFTQYYGGKGLDASLLLIPISGFLPAMDPRVLGTVAAIEHELLQDGLVLRFKPEGDVDGLSGEEGVFLACSFWLAAVYHMQGREEDARKLFERVISLANDVGLLAEEYDPKGKRQLGNFPQAFSHFPLINLAYLLSEQKPIAT